VKCQASSAFSFDLISFCNAIDDQLISQMHKMKAFLILFLIFYSLPTVLAQIGGEGPISQAEYVQMLYDLERNPSNKQTVIDSLRSRGISFPVTSGIRSLTSSKSRGDAELRRTLEEAGRRRANPNQQSLPADSEVGNAISRSRAAVLESLEQMPDFVVKQQIQRSASYAGTNNFRNLDRLVVGVSYRSSGAEEYKVLSLNGVLQHDSSPKSSYEELGGTSSTGEFVTVLTTIFKPESETRFELIDTDTLRGRRTYVLGFRTDKERAKQVIISSGASAVTGMSGRVWIDRENFRVLRIESQATDIPIDFPVTVARRIIDYDWVDIADGRYLLPSLSDIRLTIRQGSQTYETRNLIRFRDYQKFGTEIRILDEDEEISP
jgi:hypothetical protein